MDYKEAIARAIVACGGRVGPGHGDGGWRRSSSEHWHGAGAYLSRTAGTGRGNGVLGRWWSYGGGAGVARRELASLMATAEAGRSSLLRLRWRRKPEAKWERWEGAGGSWRDAGAPRRIVAWLGRAEATRGRFPLHAAAKA